MVKQIFFLYSSECIIEDINCQGENETIEKE